MPELIHTFFKKSAAGDFDSARVQRSLLDIDRIERTRLRTTIIAAIAVTALISASFVYAFNRDTAPPWIAGGLALIGIVAFAAALRRTR